VVRIRASHPSRHSWLRRFAAIGPVAAAATAAAVFSLSSPATADSPGGTTVLDWGGNDLVGCGGDSAGGYVVAVQDYLWGAGFPITAVDDQYGTQTFNAVRFFQGLTGLAPDGCVGPATWRTMRGFLANAASSGDYEYISGSGGRFAGFYSPRACTYWQTNLAVPAVPVAPPVAGGTLYPFSRSLTSGSCTAGPTPAPTPAAFTTATRMPVPVMSVRAPGWLPAGVTLAGRFAHGGVVELSYALPGPANAAQPVPMGTSSLPMPATALVYGTAPYGDTALPTLDDVPPTIAVVPLTVTGQPARLVHATTGYGPYLLTWLSAGKIHSLSTCRWETPSGDAGLDADTLARIAASVPPSS
jgi:Putative peptidoglycan binding domain